MTMHYCDKLQACYGVYQLWNPSSSRKSTSWYTLSLQAVGVQLPCCLFHTTRANVFACYLSVVVMANLLQRKLRESRNV